MLGQLRETLFTGITLVSDGWSGAFLILLLSDVIHVLRLCELSSSGLLEFIWLSV